MLDHKPGDKARQVLLPDKVLHARRQQQRLIDRPRAKCLAHQQAESNSRHSRHKIPLSLGQAPRKAAVSDLLAAHRPQQADKPTGATIGLRPCASARVAKVANHGFSLERSRPESLMDFVLCARSAGALILLGCLSILFVGGPFAAGPSGPFQGLAGAWTGEGSIGLSSGVTERLRCQSTYAVGGAGATMQQDLRCKSDTYVFDLHTDLTSDGGRIVGSWNEVDTRNSRRDRGTGGERQNSGDGARTDVFRGDRDRDARLSAVRDNSLGGTRTLGSFDHAPSRSLTSRRLCELRLTGRRNMTSGSRRFHGSRGPTRHRRRRVLDRQQRGRPGGQDCRSAGRP